MSYYERGDRCSRDYGPPQALEDGFKRHAWNEEQAAIREKWGTMTEDEVIAERAITDTPM